MTKLNAAVAPKPRKKFMDELGIMLGKSGWSQDEDGDWCLMKGEQRETLIAHSAREANALQRQLSTTYGLAAHSAGLR